MTKKKSTAKTVVDNPAGPTQEQLEAKQNLAEKIEESLNALDSLTSEIALDEVFLVYIPKLNKTFGFTEIVEAKSVWYDYCKAANNTIVQQVDICRSLDEFEELYAEGMRLRTLGLLTEDEKESINA